MSNSNTPLLPLAFLECVDRVGSSAALSAQTNQGPRSVSYSELLEKVLAAASVLVDNGVAPGDRVCVHIPTSIEHTVWDLAVLCAGAIAVPIYDTDSIEQIEWILVDADPSVVVVADSLRETSLKAHVNVSHRSVILNDHHDGNVQHTAEVLERIRAVTHDDIAGIIYTSGTTGRSKGCVLSHGAFASAVAASRATFPEQMSPGQSTLLFLPLAHVFARVVQYTCVTTGVEIAYSSAQTVAQDVLWARPSWMVTVPRVLEKVHAGARAKSSGLKAPIFDAADNVARSWAAANERGHVPLSLKVLRGIFDRLVYSKIRSALGGKLNAVVSGGAALDPRLDGFFTGCGIDVYEGYGLTETAAAHCANTPSAKRAGSVGRPLAEFRAQVDADGEILLSGANLFSGYWRNEDASTAAFCEIDGVRWLRTGDLGSIDTDGFLRITGRRKELIVTSNGKNVQPAGLEEAVLRTSGISQCVVVGDDRPFIAALVVLDSQWVTQRAAALGIIPAEFEASSAAREHVQLAVDEANATVSRAEAIKEFRILPEELSVANGLLTPTLKVKRRMVVSRYGDLIEEMYAG